MKLRIGHLRMPVGPLRSDTAEATPARGYHVYYPTPRIEIDAALCPPEQAEILLHEVIHACFGCFNEVRPKLTEEETATFLGMALAQVFQANPQLYEVLHSALNKGKPIV
jgi:hypothetical protein